MVEKGLIITIKEARKVLGSEYEGLSDTQIVELINTLALLARKQLMYNGSKEQ